MLDVWHNLPITIFHLRLNVTRKMGVLESLQHVSTLTIGIRMLLALGVWEHFLVIVINYREIALISHVADFESKVKW